LNPSPWGNVLPAPPNPLDPPAQAIPPGIAAIAPTPSLRKAQEWLFVLRSVGIEGWIRQSADDGAFLILLPVAIRDRALEQLRTYEVENRDYPARPAPDKPLYGSSGYAALTMIALVFFFTLTGPVSHGGRWFRAGIADSAAMLHGAPWQAVTALTLHADEMHVLGNAISGTIFLSAVHRRLGGGVGTLAVLVAGAAGNALNAVWHGPGHHSLGASTAVLAAVGVLATTQLVLNRQLSGRGWMGWVAPILGGLALLGAIGSKPGSDLFAHLWGLVAGMVVGLVAGFAVRGRTTPWHGGVQIAGAVASIGIVVGAWALALTRTV
jgi:membrane associated rhomboid family serine protease